MVSVAVKDLKGKQVAEMSLASEIFTETKPADIATMHSAVVRQLANARTGSASSKTRAEVRGGGAKPWRQKGTGRARAGSRRSPLWAGGGVIFGPKPRDYTTAMPVKMRRAAIRSALAARQNELVIVDSFSSIKEAKTKAAWKVLQDLQISNKKLLVVVDKQTDKTFALSVRNLKNVTVVHGNNMGVKELLDCEAVLTSQAMIETISKWLAPGPGKKQESHKKPTKVKATTSKVAEKTTAPKPVIAKTQKTEAVETVEKKHIEKKEESAKEKKLSPLQSIASTGTKTQKSSESTGKISAKDEVKAETKHEAKHETKHETKAETKKPKHTDASSRKEKGKGK